MYIVGVDIGQAKDYTALTILDPIPVNDRIEYHCVHVERMPLETTYQGVVDRIAWHKTNLGHCAVALDATGCGRPVVEMAQKRVGGLVIGVTITGGHHANGWKVPKKELISMLQVAFQSQTLKIANSINIGVKDFGVSQLIDELNNYRVKINVNANEEFGAWRERDHDDMVLALAIGLYVANRFKPQVKDGYGKS